MQNRNPVDTLIVAITVPRVPETHQRITTFAPPARHSNACGMESHAARSGHPDMAPYMGVCSEQYRNVAMCLVQTPQSSDCRPDTYCLARHCSMPQDVLNNTGMSQCVSSRHLNHLTVGLRALRNDTPSSSALSLQSKTDIANHAGSLRGPVNGVSQAAA